ncbi:MAG TPA: dihydroorotase, partial [Nannocystis exedens]|nr:dihydroorotase [Nannocystis exedens]
MNGDPVGAQDQDRVQTQVGTKTKTKTKTIISENQNTLTICRPDDWHLHLRDGAALVSVVGHSAANFGRALVMPNLRPPVRRLDDAIAYRQRILAALPESAQFEPLMTLYLTDETTPEELRAARDSGIVVGVKLYPAGATTNSAAGVRDLRAAAVERAFAAMQELGLPLLVHGEVTDPEVDIFDREAVFIERVLRPLCVRFPGLRVVLEHVTTTAGVDFVRQQSGDLVAATITAHHLLLNRNALLVGGLQPHHYCLPVLKRERHRRALVEAATSGDRRFFLGTDSAPHQRSAKESAC